MTGSLSLELQNPLSDELIKEFNEAIKELKSNQLLKSDLEIDISANQINFGNLRFDNQNTLDNDQANDLLDALNTLIAQASDPASENKQKIVITDQSLQQLQSYKIRYNSNPTHYERPKWKKSYSQNKELYIRKLKEYLSKQDETYISDQYAQQPLDFVIADQMCNYEYKKKHYNYKSSADELCEKTVAAEKARKEDLLQSRANGTNTDEQIFGEIPTGYSPYEFISNKTPLPNTHETRVNARKEGRKKLNEQYVDSVIKEMVEWGSNTVIVWDNEKDRQEDNLISKKGVKSHNKLFAYTVRIKNPPVIEFYNGKIGNKISGKEVAPSLKQIAELGYGYFRMPTSDELGKPLFKAYLEASIITGVVPRLKRSADDPNGMELKYGDVSDIMELWKEKTKGKDPKKKIEYALRLSQEIEEYLKGGGKENIGTFGLQLKMQATFLNFTNTYCSSLAEHMDKMAAEKKWDRADVITAKIAMTRIVKEMQEGTLFDPTDGKYHAYNPLENNFDKIKATFDYYQKDDKLKETITGEMQALQESVTYQRSIDKQIKAVEEQYTKMWNDVVGDAKGLKAYGVEIPANIFPHSTIRPKIENKNQQSYRLRNQRQQCH